jgi:chaperonin cofactor prefoldin
MPNQVDFKTMTIEQLEAYRRVLQVEIEQLQRQQSAARTALGEMRQARRKLLSQAQTVGLSSLTINSEIGR